MSFVDRMSAAFADELNKIAAHQKRAMLPPSVVTAGKVLIPGIAATLAAQRLYKDVSLAEQIRRQQGG